MTFVNFDANRRLVLETISKNFKYAAMMFDFRPFWVQYSRPMKIITDVFYEVW